MSKDLPRTPDPILPTQLRALFRRHGFRPRRRLGQTFLVDRNIVRKIVEAAQLAGQEPVLEVGAGAGAVTAALAATARRVVAIEVDPTLVAILQETVGDGATVVCADMLEVDWGQVLGSEFKGQWRVVANLPYAITGPALLRLAETREWAERMVIMVQAEVAERLAAPPGTRTRGILSVILQTLFEVEIVTSVSRTCFWPRPRVDSTILTLNVRRPALLSASLEPAFRRVVRAAFGVRRKTLSNALAHASVMDLSKSEAKRLLSQCGIDQARRAETLSEAEFLRLASALAQLQDRPR